jgi:predicted NAD/FAD-binding protein
MGTRVQSVSVAEKVSILTFADGTSKRVDYVVLAVHAKDALALLGDGATDAQRKILSAFETSKNICYLHSDTSVSTSRVRDQKSC